MAENMEKKSKHINWIIAFILTAAVALAVSCFSDCWFDLNDDVLMKDIMSGAYSGTPSGHNIQMLYPVSLLISLFYRLPAELDWYGIFLCICQYGCIILILCRILSMIEKKSLKIISAVITTIAAVSLLSGHLMFVQYTFTCAMLSGTSAFLILTKRPEAGKTGIAFMLRRNLLPIVMIWLAYLIRSEMLLLTFPMVCVAILIRFVLVIRLEGDSCKKVDSLKYYILITCVIIAGLAGGQLCHRAAYSSEGWKEFVSFFDNRTELYDFSEIPTYDENKTFYDSIGISAEEQNLLVNYNFGLDDEITADMIEKIVAYQKQKSADTYDLYNFSKLKKAASEYFYRLHHTGVPEGFEYPQTDAPWNIIMWLLYLSVFICAISYFRHDRKITLAVIALQVLLFACRSCLWGYIILRGRDPVRITHSLYLVEIFILAGMLLRIRLCADNRKSRGIITGVFLLIMTAVSAAYIPSALSICSTENSTRESVNKSYNELHEYFREHEEAFYFVDVYSSVSYSEKLFKSVDNSEYNYDIMGGWACKSPIQQAKLEKNGFPDMQQALLEGNVYMVENLEDDVSWITDYYREEGYDTEITLCDSVSGKFGIYKLTDLTRGEKIES